MGVHTVSSRELNQDNPLRKMRLCDQLRIIMRSAYYRMA